LKTTTIMILAALALALAACGDDEDSGEAAESSVTPETAIEEIGAVRTGLDDAIASYADGDAATAADTVNETYLEHFELVEVPLEEADEELNEELEEQIREELVAEIESEAPRRNVEDLVAEIGNGLDEAEAALTAASQESAESAESSGSGY
jgi:SMC interacting uncharacterized protein involved in chromosome segregation